MASFSRVTDSAGFHSQLGAVTTVVVIIFYSIDSLNDEIAKLKKTLEFEKASRKQQLANLQSVYKATQAELKDVSKRFLEEQRRSHKVTCSKD